MHHVSELLRTSQRSTSVKLIETEFLRKPHQRLQNDCRNLDSTHGNVFARYELGLDGHYSEHDAILLGYLSEAYATTLVHQSLYEGAHERRMSSKQRFSMSNKNV